MTTNHPDPTPPTSPAAVSAPLRPVEELFEQAERWLHQCGFCDAGLATDCTCPRGDFRNVIADMLARLRAAEETLAEMAPLLIARSDSESLIEGLEKVRRRLCHYGPAALTCDCKYGASFKGEQSGCPELRRAIAALAEGASR